MDLSLSDEQRLLKDTFRRLLEKESAPARVRAAAPLGFDSALWTSLIATGAPLTRVPESAGGLEMSLLDAAIIAEEAGRALASAPLVEVMAAARLLAFFGKTGAEWIEKIATGTIVVPALQPGSGGVALNVPGGAVAEAVVALDGDALVLVTGGRQAPKPNIGHIPIASWNLHGDGTPASRIVLASGADARRAIDAALAEWKLLSAATLAGLARRALELAAAYACERVQFGRPIGSFQGLAHPLADSVTEVDGGQLFVWKAIAATAAKDQDAAALISLAWWWIGQATVTAVRRAVRALGGYGLSLEYDLQLYNRRGNALVLLGGDPLRELERAGDILYANEPASLPEAGEVNISFSVGEAGVRHAEKTEAFFRANWNNKLQAKAHHSSKSHNAEFHKKLAASGLIFGRWPAAHGGTGLSAAEDFAGGNVFETWNYTTHIIATTSLVAAIVMQFGSDEAKAEILPRIKAGEAVCSLGFSEPSAGSDVFAARTAAVRDGADWIINGQKMFTTAGHFSDYVILLTRTTTGGPKHTGLTLFIVPTNLPGYAFQPIETYQDERTNITFYADLRLPDKYRLGAADDGASVMAAALMLEQGSETHYFRAHMRMQDKALTWARAKDATGVIPLQDRSVRARLAKVRARYEVASCFVARGIWAADAGQAHRAWGPMAKMFITDSALLSAWDILEMSGTEGMMTGDHPLGFVELDHRRAYGMTIYGGANEIHRSLVAEQALGLPKSRS